jgi:serine/threonine protein kinase
MTNINIPNIIKLTYLYENRLVDGSYELWMIFETRPPGINRTLNHFIDEHTQQKTYISLKKICQIMVPIIDALVALHENELVHRNVKPTNILFDEEDQIFLADLGDWYLPDDNSSDDVESRHHISIDSNGTNQDLKGFGQLGFILYTIVDHGQVSSTIFEEFKQFLETCIKATLKADEIRNRLRYLYEKLNRYL